MRPPSGSGVQEKHRTSPSLSSTLIARHDFTPVLARPLVSFRPVFPVL
jgi:hypothetical protein